MPEQHHRLNGMFMRAMRMHRRIVEGRIQNLDIHPSQHFVLMQLSHSGPMASQSRIAEMMDVSPASVARTVKHLDENGYIRRSGGQRDSRCNEISITPKGEAVVSESRRIFQQVDALQYENFTAEELDRLEVLLEKLIANLSLVEQSDKK